MSATTRQLRSWAGRVALAAASVALTLLVLEVAFRFVGVNVGTVQINRATVRRSSDPRLRFELRPGGVARAEVEYRINALGLRGPETRVGKPAGVRRVVVLGDSIAFGYWVAEQDAFPRQLETLLNASTRAERVEVLGFGVPGYNLEQEIETLRVKALAFAPDVVVVAFCLNDLEGVFSYELGLVQDRAERRRSPLGRARDVLLEHSLLFSWLEYRFSELEARRSYVRVKNPLGEDLHTDTLRQERQALDARFGALAALLRPRGVPAVVVVFPVLSGAFDKYPYRRLHETILDAAGAAGLGGVDLLGCYGAYALRDLRIDVVHPSPLGHRVAAHAVRDALCARGWACDDGLSGATTPACTDYRPADFPRLRGY